jgi:hypothetical protein
MPGFVPFVCFVANLKFGFVCFVAKTARSAIT